jgi:hypothetical protein
MSDSTVVENNSGSTRTGGVTGKGFMPGTSGNPGGRPKRNPITDAVLKELAKQHGRQGRTKLEAAVAAFVTLMISGRPKDKLEAFKVILPYTDTQMPQTVEIDVYDAARREAEARGLDPDKVVSILEGLKQRRTG